MLETILLYVVVLLSGIAIGIGVATFILRDYIEHLQKQHDKYMWTLSWIRRIPDSCWHNEEFLNHIHELTDTLQKEDE